MDPHLSQFLKKYVPLSASIGIALSGGPDSRALFDLLKAFKGSLFKELHILHVDHGWREESKLEAKAIAAWAKEGSFPFHLKQLEPKKHNREALAREERIAFFREVALREGLFSLFLAHHKDDQLENGVKRFFVSGRWELVKGMAPIERMGDLILMRPLLSFSKEELKRSIQGPYFTDVTNSCPEISERVRMRMQLLPEVRRTFGKEVEAPLFQVLKDLREIEEWMTPQLEEIDRSAVSGPFGTYWRLDAPQPILKLWLRKRFNLSRAEERGLLEAVSERRSALQFGSLFLYRGRLIQKGTGRGVWRLEEGAAASGFEALFKGIAACPSGDLLQLHTLKGKELKKIKERRAKAHIPSVLWNDFPVIRKGCGNLFDPALPGRETTAFRINYQVDVETLMW